ncbi:UNVERIFIED_ORG: phenylacetate-CoA ligase [Burkholderia contaminans]|nr:phenylacetate-CoA ligase [Burkholderia contaminans]
MHQSLAVREHVNALVQSQQDLIRNWDAVNPDEYYLRRLRTVLSAALALPFYGELYRNSGVPPVDGLFDGHATYYDILGKLPFMSKAESRSVSNDVLEVNRGKLINYFETSGTTDVPVSAPKALDDLVLNTVNFGEGWSSFLDASDSAVILINTPQGPAAFQFEKALNYLGIFTFRTWVDTVRNDYGRVIETIERIRPTVFAGAPSQLLNLYEFASIRKLAPPKFRKVLLTGENSSVALKARIGHLTGASVFDASYGSSETGTTAVAISPGTMKLQEHSYIFELLDAQNASLRPSGKLAITGELVVTSLDNLSKPLVRYRTGDLVTIEPLASGGKTLVPMGRLSDNRKFEWLNADQATIESLIWGRDGRVRIFNYVIARTPEQVHFLVTGDYGSSDALRDDVPELRRSFPEASIVLVPKLPEIASLGSAIGWKMSRIHDLTKSYDEYPAHTAGAIQELKRFVEAVEASTAKV